MGKAPSQTPASTSSSSSFKPRKRGDKPSKRRKSRQTFQTVNNSTQLDALPQPGTLASSSGHPSRPSLPFQPSRHPQSSSTTAGQKLPDALASQPIATKSARPSRWDERSSSHATTNIEKSLDAQNQGSSNINVTDETDWHWYHNDEGNDEGAAGVRSDMQDDALVARRQSRKLTARAASKMADTARWETNQLASGLHAIRSSSSSTQTRMPLDDDAGPRVALLVNEQTPDFLKSQDGFGSRRSELFPNDNVNNSTNNISVTTQVGNTKGNAVIGDTVVWPVKDTTSDMAVIARNGSATVKSFRENRERGKPRVKYWDLGSHTGAKSMEEAQADAEQLAKAASVKAASSEDWKKDMRFGNLLNKTGKGSEENKLDGTDEEAIEKAKPNQFKKENEISVVKPKSVEEVRRSLPVYSVKRELMNVLRDHQVCIVVGETGSGKTTQLAQYLQEEGYGQFGIIGCTQPRRVAAVSVAQRVSEEFRGGCTVGEEVGYTIRFEDCSSDKTVIKFMTDGILMRESLSDSDLDKYSVIIMDEAHERSLNTDVLFGILRGVISKRRDLKVVITSATMNAEKFSKFFGGAPIYTIPGRTYPVDIFYSRTPVEDYVQSAVFQAVQLHIQAPLPGDILIFMTGQEDIEATCETLAEEIGKRNNPRPILIVPIYSQLAADMQAKIFEAAPEGTRKVVVATNIAETSVTIHGIKYVIDAGYCKLKTYNPRLGMDALLLCPASQASVNQRAGRAGRTGPGKCYRLFTNAAYSTELLESNVPEIQRTNLSHVVLLLKTLGVDNVLDFPFLDPPPRGNILGSMHGLWLLGALGADGDVTQLGQRMAIFPLDPALSALIFIGEKLGCLVETVTIVAMLSVPNAFVRPHGREEESDSAREKFFIPESDHLTLLHVYQRWRAAGCRSDWCARNYINSKSLSKAREVREQLLEIARTQHMNESRKNSHHQSDEWDDIRKAIAVAFFYQAARRKGIGEYVNIRSGVVCGLHPTSAMYGSGLTPDYVVYHELIMTKKEYMSCVTAVEPYWLAEAGPMLYTLKRAGVEDTKLASALKE